jgi:hypothetical protein
MRSRKEKLKRSAKAASENWSVGKRKASVPSVGQKHWNTKNRCRSLGTWTTIRDCWALRSLIPGVSSITFAPSTPATAYAALRSGRIFRKIDISSASPWEERTQCGIEGVREFAVAASATGHLYVANEDRVRFSEDDSETWHDRVGTGTDTLPPSVFNSIVTHPHDSETVFVGADIGVFISTDEGQHWQPFDVALPNARVVQIFWRNGWLYAVTFGRGLWRRSPCL